MAVFKRWNGTSWEVIGPTISNSRINTVEELIAPEYDPNSPYSVGDFVVHSDTLYKCNTAISSGGELWNSTHWTETKIGDEVNDLKSALNSIALTSFNIDLNAYNYNRYFTDADDAPLNKIVLIAGSITSVMVSNLPIYGIQGTLITFSYLSSAVNTKCQMYITAKNLIYTRIKSAGIWSDWSDKIVTKDELDDELDDVINEFGDEDILSTLTFAIGYINENGNIITSDSAARYTESLIQLTEGYYVIESVRNVDYAYNLRVIEYTENDTYERQFAWFRNTSGTRTINEFYVPYDMYVRISIGGYINGTTKLYSAKSIGGTACDTFARQLANANDNLINLSTVIKGFTINANGSIVNNQNGCYTSFIMCIPGERYTLSVLRSYTTHLQSNIRVHGYNSKKEWLQQIAVINLTDNSQGVKSQTFIVPYGCEYLIVSNGYYEEISMKLEYGNTATAGYEYLPETPNEDLRNLVSLETKSTENVLQLYRGTIDDNGNTHIDNTVTDCIYSFMGVVQNGETICFDIPSYGYKYRYNIYLYTEKFVFNKKANTYWQDASSKTYITGPCLYRIFIKTRNGEAISATDFSDLSENIKINTVVAPIMDKRPRYALIGNPGIYKCPDIDYLVTSNMTAEFIYGMYDALVEAYPNNITKETLGTAFNLPIYCYTFQPTVPKTWHHYGEQWNVAEWGNDPKLPMILIVAGTHGNEKGTVYGLAKYMTQMWGDDATAETNYIRDNAVVKVVPILNVSGFADNTRNNRNNVNLNRDFGAFTQTESVIMKNLYNDNKDFIRVMIDYHQTPTRPSFWADPKDDITQNIIRTLAMPLGNYWEEQKPELKAYSPRFEFWYFDVAGAQSSWFSSQGVIATTCESTWNINGMKGNPVWSTNDLFTEKCGVDLLGNTLIQFLKAVPNFEQSYFERFETLEIIDQPTDQTVANGSIAEFTVGVIGYSPTYQWQYCADNSRNFVPVANGYVYPSEENPYAPTWSKAANSNIWPTLRVQASNDNNGYWYRCKVYDQFNNVRYSKEVQLFVT